ncbi:MAG: hypothetical protein QUS09_01435, partial [Methanotrichaceae archaeon]|nr:hypothetical protein [Methanotrichaceae archaeon]
SKAHKGRSSNQTGGCRPMTSLADFQGRPVLVVLMDGHRFVAKLLSVRSGQATFESRGGWRSTHSLEASDFGNRPSEGGRPMTELRALQRRRQYLLKRLAEAADEIKKIDERLAFLLAGRRKPGAGAV